MSRPDATIHEALEQILRTGTKAMPLATGRQVAGVISLGDLAPHVYQAPGLPSIQRVAELMRPPVTVPTDLPVPEAMAAAVSDPAGLLLVTWPDGTAAGYRTSETLPASGPTSDHMHHHFPDVLNAAPAWNPGWRG